MSIKEYKLGEVVKIIRGKKPKPLTDYITVDHSDIPWVKISDLNSNSLINTKTFFKRQEKNKTCFIQKNSLLLTIEGSVGIPFINYIDCCIDNHISEIKCTNKIIKKYTFYWLIKNKKTIENLSTGTVLLSISKKELEKIKIFVPDIKTQQQIIDIIEPKEELFKKYNNLVNIESIDEFKKSWSVLIDIIEPFEKKLNLEYENLSKLNTLLENIAKWLNKKEKVNFLSLADFSGSGYKNQKKYIDTSNISKSILKDFEDIKEKRKSRANLTPNNNSIIFSKLKGENKIYPIYYNEEKEFVFSTGFENIKSKYNSYIYGVMISNEFLDYKNLSCSGSVMAGLTKSAISNWEIYDIDKEKWNEDFNKILKLISIVNKKIIILKKIINNLLEKYIK